MNWPTEGQHTLEIWALIQKFDNLFQTSTSLPSTRNTNHAINLHPNSNSVNVHPYRYSYFQKQEIETQVESMLKNGIIRPIISLFSSPILLVKKHDGSWRFCMDYRVVNTIVVMDQFLILTVDELLDELGGARWFSKLNLL